MEMIKFELFYHEMREFALIKLKYLSVLLCIRHSTESFTINF